MAGPKELLDEIDRDIGTVRSQALQRFLYLYRSAYGLKPLWQAKHLPGKKGVLSVASVQQYLGCSRRTAYDYIAAFQLIEKIEQLRRQVLRAAPPPDHPTPQP